MTRATRREKAAAAVRERLESEAAQVLAARMAEGRPPEAEWVAAAQRRARQGPQAGGWYTSAPPSAVTRPQHAPLVLRVVRPPVRRRAAAPLR